MGTEFETHSGVKQSAHSKKHLRVVGEKEAKRPTKCPACESTNLLFEQLEEGTLIRCVPQGHYTLMD